MKKPLWSSSTPSEALSCFTRKPKSRLDSLARHPKRSATPLPSQPRCHLSIASQQGNAAPLKSEASRPLRGTDRTPLRPFNRWGSGSGTAAGAHL